MSDRFKLCIYSVVESKWQWKICQVGVNTKFWAFIRSKGFCGPIQSFCCLPLTYINIRSQWIRQQGGRWVAIPGGLPWSSTFCASREWIGPLGRDTTSRLGQPRMSESVLWTSRVKPLCEPPISRVYMRPLGLALELHELASLVKGTFLLPKVGQSGVMALSKDFFPSPIAQIKR